MEPWEGAGGVAAVFGGDAFVADDAVILEEVEDGCGVEPVQGDEVAEGGHSASLAAMRVSQAETGWGFFLAGFFSRILLGQG